MRRLRAIPIALLAAVALRPESSANIPMLMRWPTGLVPGPRGRPFAQPVELRRVLPAFMDAAGAPVNRQIDGRSLLSLVRNRLTDGRWKHIFHAHDGEEQLFDPWSDQYELHDLLSPLFPKG
jgi:arylsulfatase A-like enzyme